MCFCFCLSKERGQVCLEILWHVQCKDSSAITQKHRGTLPSWMRTKKECRIHPISWTAPLKECAIRKNWAVSSYPVERLSKLHLTHVNSWVLIHKQKAWIVFSLRSFNEMPDYGSFLQLPPSSVSTYSLDSKQNGHSQKLNPNTKQSDGATQTISLLCSHILKSSYAPKNETESKLSRFSSPVKCRLHKTSASSGKDSSK